MDAARQSDAIGCICSSCGTKWEMRKGYCYSGFPVVQREYKQKDGTTRVENLVSLLCAKCVEKRNCEGQEVMR